LPIALITGSGRRLGRQLAYAFADAGYDIILHAHASVDGLAEAERVLGGKGVRVFTLRGDLRSMDEIRSMATETATFTDRLDVLVNNAGVFPEASIEDVTEEMWDLAQDVNTKALFFLTQALLSPLRAAGGNVVNILSAGGFEPWKKHIPYNVSKAGAVMLTRALAKALAPRVRVNGIAPGVILIPGEEERDHIPADRFPMQRYGTPRDVAEAALFLATSASYITGHIIPVTGGEF
jgi:NAD(P)-dependent dehydrogenase (short-subunit alcohol dehydrogenase family)